MESSLRICQASFGDMASIVGFSWELATHVGDPDPGSDASLLSDSGFGHDRWFECFVAEECSGTKRTFAAALIAK